MNRKIHIDSTPQSSALLTYCGIKELPGVDHNFKNRFYYLEDFKLIEDTEHICATCLASPKMAIDLLSITEI